ncbi:hypothetical protein HNQ38_001756 [Desulfovibrio intestinalis]|uniref:Uncharacterized protein n=1 Tax=Desulfovibrio intestinalis TaxID=58621 RepID=A0A7W8FED4_9BACT|nr:hypothetical protein [Desulfovibrio intestinalis]
MVNNQLGALIKLVGVFVVSFFCWRVDQAGTTWKNFMANGQ